MSDFWNTAYAGVFKDNYSNSNKPNDDWKIPIIIILCFVSFAILICILR